MATFFTLSEARSLKLVRPRVLSDGNNHDNFVIKKVLAGVI